MLQRTITALVGICIAVFLVIISGTIAYNFTIAGLTVILLWEALRANKCNEYKLLFSICLMFGTLLPFFSLSFLKPFSEIFYICFALIAFFLLLIYFEKIQIEKFFYMVGITILISFSMNCLMEIRNAYTHGAYYLCLTLAAPWISDAGAYFVGVTMGKHKLCPSISPKKTIEGAVGGVVVTAVVFSLACFVYKVILGNSGLEIHVNYVFAAVFAFASSFLAIIGDLVASLIKRQVKIKDFGNIMPGHGGLLDRFDSVLFVAPVMMLALRYIQFFY
ncbi:MAG: phosphatidate cytidylyltransferase [Oscillospiraceae bacterium]